MVIDFFYDIEKIENILKLLCVGGYQVCQKWLKDRRGRRLDYEDICHYQKIAVALGETIRLMERVDKAIEESGGWPME